MYVDFFQYLDFCLKLFLSLLVSYSIGTFIEYIFHRFVGHPPEFLSRLLERFPLWLKDPIWEARAGHDIHHKLTEENFYNQRPHSIFHTQHIDNYLKQFPTLKKHNDTTQFGMSFDIYSILSAFLLTGPLSIIILYIGNNYLLWYLVLPLPLAFITLTSRYIHPLIHRPYTELIESKNYLIRLIAVSPYYKYIKNKHFLHHRSDGQISFNLVPGFEQFLEFVDAFWMKLKKIY